MVYYDGQFDDARLAVTLARTAASFGAVVLNYVDCVGLKKENGKVAGVLAKDMETGAEFEIAGRAVLNATGVFVDELRKKDETGDE